MKLFAGLRERAGTDEIEVELDAGATTDDLLAELGDLTEGVRCVVAVNREYSGPGTTIHPGDEVALVPPISGGAGGNTGAHGAPGRRSQADGAGQ